MSVVMHTCDLDWGRTPVLMLCVLLILKLRLWEDVRDWVGPIKSNRPAEAGPEPGDETGAGFGAVTGVGLPAMGPKRSFVLFPTVWADGGICPPGKAFHSPKSPLLLEAGATDKRKKCQQCEQCKWMQDGPNKSQEYTSEHARTIIKKQPSIKWGQDILIDH